MAKCVLKVAGHEIKEAFRTEQLCREMRAGIERGIQTMRLMWVQHAHEEDWGFLLIAACNKFNEENRTEILWDVQFKWPGGAQFTLNWYLKWYTLVVRDVDGSGNLLYSKEGVNQGYPLAMIAYVIGILPIIRDLRTVINSALLWLTDNPLTKDFSFGLSLYFG